MSTQQTLFGGAEKESRSVQALAIYKAYPRKGGRAKALQHIEAALKREEFKVILARVDAFAEKCKAAGTEEEFIQLAKTWFGVNGDWLDVVRRPAVDAVLTRQRAIGDRARRDQAEMDRAYDLDHRRSEAAKAVMLKYEPIEVNAAYQRHLLTIPMLSREYMTLGMCTTYIAELLEPGCLAEVK